MVRGRRKVGKPCFNWKRGSSWTSDVIIRSLSSLCVRNYCNIELSTWSTTFCTICSCWRHFETDGQLLMPGKPMLGGGLMGKMTRSVHYHVLSLKCLCILTTNRISLGTDCSARCIIKCCFCFCSMQWLSYWRSCTVDGPRTLCILIGPHAWKGGESTLYSHNYFRGAERWRKTIGVREGILLGGRKKFALKLTICPKNRQLALKLTF